jgi:hypothetical protein
MTVLKQQHQHQQLQQQQHKNVQQQKNVNILTTVF